MKVSKLAQKQLQISQLQKRKKQFIIHLLTLFHLSQFNSLKSFIHGYQKHGFINSSANTEVNWDTACKLILLLLYCASGDEVDNNKPWLFYIFWCATLILVLCYTWTQKVEKRSLVFHKSWWWCRLDVLHSDQIAEFHVLCYLRWVTRKVL